MYEICEHGNEWIDCKLCAEVELEYAEALDYVSREIVRMSDRESMMHNV